MVSPGAASTCWPSSSKTIPGRVRFLALTAPLGITPASPPAFAPWEYVPPSLDLADALGPPASTGVGVRTVCGCSRCGGTMGSVLMLTPAGPLLRGNARYRREQLGE